MEIIWSRVTQPKQVQSPYVTNKHIQNPLLHTLTYSQHLQQVLIAHNILFNQKIKCLTSLHCVRVRLAPT